MSYKNFPACVAAVSMLLTVSSYAVPTTWSGLEDGLFWDSPGNWDTDSAPTSADEAIFSSDFTENAILDDFTVGAITFGSSLSLSNQIKAPGGNILTVNGNITNSGSVTQIFRGIVSAGNSNSTWTGPLTFSNTVNLGTRRITLDGTFVFSAGPVNFDLNSTASYGRFLGTFSGTFTGITINIGGTYSGGVAGNTFDFTTGNFSGATLGDLPALSGGLAWDTSSFLSEGILTVSAVPEPASYAVLLGLASLGFCARRKRREA